MFMDSVTLLPADRYVIYNKTILTEFDHKTLIAFYEPITFENAQNYGIDVTKWENHPDPPKKLWKRHGYSFKIETELPTTKISGPISLEAGIQLQIFTHTVFESGKRVVTVVMLNTNISEKEKSEDKIDIVV